MELHKNTSTSTSQDIQTIKTKEWTVHGRIDCAEDQKISHWIEYSNTEREDYEISY